MKIPTYFHVLPNVLLILSSLSLSGADVHPFTAKDLVTFDKLSSPVPSPDGKHVAFTVSRYNPDENKSKRSLWFLHMENNAVVNAEADIAEPVWLGSGLIGGLADANGTTQFWYGDVSGLLGGGGNTTIAKKPKFQPLTDYPVDIGNVKYNPKGSLLAFTAEVYQDGSLEEAARRRKREAERFSTGVVYDQLFVRHWDHYVHPQRRSQLFVVQLKIDGSSVSLGGKPVNLMKGEKLETPVAPFGDVSNFDFSPDGAEMAFSSRVPGHDAAWNTNLDIYIVPTNGREKPKAISAYNKGADSYPVYSPDGKHLAWLQMPTPQYEADKNDLILYDRSTGKHRTLVRHWKLSPESLTWLPDSSGILATAQHHGHVKIFQIDLRDKRGGKVSTLVSEHTNDGVSVVNNTVVFGQNSWTGPAEIFALELGLNAAHPVQKTRFNEKHLMETLTSDPEEFWFKGAKGDKVMGWLFKPVSFDVHSTRQYPLAFLIHGGPEGAWNDGWSYRWNPQTFAGAGYAVVMINFHGSTGYGQDFTRAIVKDWGGAPYKDLMKGLDYALEEFTFIDRKRVAALGASYGGYMINWINGQTDRFACLVNHDGIFDTRGTYYATEELWFPEFEASFPHISVIINVAVFISHLQPFPAVWCFFIPVVFQFVLPLTLHSSNTSHVKNWKTPTLVIHGEKDYRLPVTEGLSTFTALQRHGVPSRLLYFPDENHWVLKPANSLLWNKEVLGWLDTWT
ncbi:hypothetical protein HK104_004019, partial [Borealophlyctis nickersoniae]